MNNINAKVINISHDNEPEIYAAISKPDILLENVDMSSGALEKHIPVSLHRSLALASQRASVAAEEFRNWLDFRINSMHGKG